MNRFLWVALTAVTYISWKQSAFVQGFVNDNLPQTRSASTSSSLLLSSPGQEVEDDPAIQWELFNKHHAKGSWKGVWTSYDYIGDVIDETVASVDLNKMD